MELSRGCSARHAVQRPAAGRRGGSYHVVNQSLMRMHSCANVRMAQQAYTCGTLSFRSSSVRVAPFRQRSGPRSPLAIQCALPATENGPKGLAGSKLPPRIPKESEAAGAAAEHKGSSHPKPRIRRRTGPPRAPPPVRPSMEQSLASLLAFSGLTGTVAVVAAALAHVNPFHTFSFAAHDIQTGMQFMLPVFLANAVLLLPQYSSWELPSMPTGAAAGLGEASGSGGSTVSSSSSSGSGSLQDGPAGGVPSTLGMGDVHPASNVASREVLPVPSTSARPPLTALTDPSPSQQLLKQLRSTLHFAQSHYLGGTVAGQLPLSVEAAVLGVECLAAEMLYRSVALQALGGWVLDRWYESGWEAPQGPWAHLAAGATDTQLAQGGALALLTGLSGLLVLQRMARAARRAPFMHALQQQLAMEQQRGAGTSGMGGQEEEAAGARTPAPPLSPSAAAAATALRHAQQGSTQQQQQPPAVGPLAPSGGLGQLLLAASDAMVWSRGLQGLRDCSQFAALGLTYVVTGNLAACYVVALAHELQMTVLQRYARARLRERSIAFAAKLSDMNKRLRLHARNRRNSASAGPDAVLPGSSNSSSSSSSSSSDSALPEARQSVNTPHLLSPGSVMEGLHVPHMGDGTNSPLSSVPAAAAALSREEAAEAAPAAAAAVPESVVATWEGAPGTLSGAAVEPATMATSLEKTINALDSLLGQLEEQPAA